MSKKKLKGEHIKQLLWIWEEIINWRNVEEMADNIETPDDHRDPELSTTLYGLFLTR